MARMMHASLYDWIVYQRRSKARERKGERKTGKAMGLYKYLERAAKALVVSEPMAAWQNLAPSSTATFHRFPPVP